MIAVDAAASQPLVTFRLSRPLGEMTPGERIDVTALGGHRPHYLTYEGPVGGDRGSVVRLWRGEARWLERSDESMRAVLRSATDPDWLIRLHRQVNDRWILEFAGGDDRSPAE